MRRWSVWLIPVLLLLGWSGWRFVAKQREAAEIQAGLDQRKKAGPSVEVAPAGEAQIEETVEAVGSVESPFTVELSAKTAGTVDYLEVREGAEVKPGQVLVRIDPSDLQGQVYQQQAAVAQARSRLAQAALTQGATDTQVASEISSQLAALQSSRADYSQVKQNYAAQVAAAEAQVTDADAKVASAVASVDAARADLGAAKASYANAATRLARVEDLYRQKFIAAQDVDDARAALEVQKGAVEVAAQKLSSAQSSLNSAKAQREAAAKQASIVKRKGLSDIEAAKAKTSQSEAQYRVAQANRSQSPAYRENLAALKAGVSAATGQLSSARSKLSDTVLKSSIEGTVTARTVDPGTVVSAGKSIVTVQYLKWLYISVSVPFEQIGKIAKGQKAVVTLDAYPGRRIVGKVDEINPAADPTSRQFGVRIKVDNSDRSLKPGMYARVSLVVSVKRVPISVPREALNEDGERTTVFVVDAQNKAHEREIKLGVNDGAKYEVVDGVKAGERVVVLTYSPVKDGQTVRLDGDRVREKGKP